MAVVNVLLILVIYTGNSAYGASVMSSTTPPYSPQPKSTPKYKPEPTLASIHDLREMFEHMENRMLQMSERVDSNMVSVNFTHLQIQLIVLPILFLLCVCACVCVCVSVCVCVCVWVCV